jgi:hypothetical protein
MGTTNLYFHSLHIITLNMSIYVSQWSDFATEVVSQWFGLATEFVSQWSDFAIEVCFSMVWLTTKA